MYESKVSTVRSENWQAFSVLKNPSSKPTNIPCIPCPTHTQYSITNICKSPGCIQPLCPQCITGHVELHQQTRKPAKIQNIINTRGRFIQQLQGNLEELNSQVTKYQANFGANLNQILQKSRKKIQFAKSKVNNFVTKFFQNLDDKYQLLENAYLIQKQKKAKQMKVKIAPLINQIQQINDYKTQLQSQDYIPALIELLNQPLKKPISLNKLQFQDYGQIKMDQQSFQTFKTSLQQYISINCNFVENKFTKQLSQNSRLSNQMKFSQIGRSSSRQLIESKLQMKQSQRDRSNSRKKIFSNEKDNTTQSRLTNTKLMGNSNLNTNINLKQQVRKIKLSFSPTQLIPSPIDHTYFKYDKGLIAYFPPNQRYFYAVQTLLADRGFQRFQLPQDFIIPYQHQLVVSSDCRMFLIGGQIQNQVLNTHLEILLKLPSRATPAIKTLSPMRQARTKFGVVFFNEQIFVFGGKRGKQILNSCQKYNIASNCWSSIKSMPQGLFSCNLCVFNQVILKFGGILQSSQPLNRIDIYHPHTNHYQSIPSQIPFYIKMGSIQINQQQLLIFGGQTQFNNKRTQCYLVREEKVGEWKMGQAENLYGEGSFQQTLVFRNAVYAVQNGDHGKSKVIMRFANNKWRFLAC